MTDFQEGDRVETFDGFEGEVHKVLDRDTYPINVRHWVAKEQHYVYHSYGTDELTKLTEGDA